MRIKILSQKILWVVIFAIAFGFVEAAVVVYLRHLLGATQPQMPQGEILFLVPGIAFFDPKTAVEIISDSAILNVEMIREAATLVILAAIAALAGSNIRERITYFFLAFGTWDIFYYVFLKLTIDWPKTLGDLDIFFLLPFPWIGPVFVPIVISSVLILSSAWFILNKGGIA